MLPNIPAKHIPPRPLYWGFKRSFVHKYEHGEQALSDFIISFHHIDSDEMYVLDSFFYKFRRVSLIDVTYTKNYEREEDLISSLKSLSIDNLIDFVKN
uniref:Transposase n=1 Tax=Panagrellus redivivus TaxID=6233 RepID=A0A7E4VAI0_PANRE